MNHWKETKVSAIRFISITIKKILRFFYLDFNVFIFMKCFNVSTELWMIRDGHFFIWKWVSGGWREGRGRSLSPGGVGSL